MNQRGDGGAPTSIVHQRGPHSPEVAHESAAIEAVTVDAEIVEAGNEVQASLDRANKLKESLNKIIADYEGRSSEFLVGTVGATAGLVGAPAIALKLGLIASIYTPLAPIGLLAGGAFAIVAYRGSGDWRLERASRKFKRLSRQYLEELEQLENRKDVPVRIRQDLWDAYGAAVKTFSGIANRALKDQQSASDKFIERVLRSGRDS